MTSAGPIVGRSLARALTVRHGPAVLAYAALTVLFAWPLIASPGTRAPHDLGDPLLSTWTVWWNATRVPFTEGWWNGDIFYPSTGALAFSDHRVGIGLITTPLVLAGVSPLAAHNVAWTLSYFLSAVTAYLLGWSLTGSRAAGFIAGLVFTFHPFRAEHLPHLELLSAYWLPVVLFALHRWLDSRDRRWLVLLSVSFALVGVTTGYYFLFLCILLALWIAWFLPWNLPLREYGRLAVALALPLAAIAPVFAHYRAVHRQYGLARSITEIESLSADIRGWITPPEQLFLWNAPASWHTAEGALFPGLTAVLLISAAAFARWRESQSPRVSTARREANTSRFGSLRRLALGAGVVAVLTGLAAAVWGPVVVPLGLFHISVTQPYKPLSLGAIFIVLWAVTAPSIRRSWRMHSRFGFYVLAAVAMAVLTLGPTARFAGERVFYKAPYSWLMVLPGFSDGLRVPARFAMMAALCLAPAAALAFVALTKGLHSSRQRLAAAVISLCVLADGWVLPLPVAPAPAPLAIPVEVPSDAAILELPTGVFEDAAAMYHGSQHGHPVVNGLSGYEPPHYAALQSAIRDRDTGVVEQFAVDRPLAVFVAKIPATAGLTTILPSQSRARPLGATASHDVFLLPAAPRGRAPMPQPANAVAIRSLDATVNAALLDRAQDGDRRTAWIADGPQRGGEQLTIALASPTEVSGVVLSLGGFTWGFPRQLTISLSNDGQNWRAVWNGPTGAQAVAAALDDPLEVRVLLEFSPSQATYLRLSQTGQSEESAWAVAEIAVMRP